MLIMVIMPFTGAFTLQRASIISVMDQSCGMVRTSLFSTLRRLSMVRKRRIKLL
jgi:hypothetical protein